MPCENCGRLYDATLFEFGRTINCTCGCRVSMAPRRRLTAEAGRPRFFADVMLGRLARWLRLLGFDTAFESDVSDADLVRRALLEDRVVLTRDRRLPREWRTDAVYVVDSHSTSEQLAEVMREFKLSAQLRLFRICSRCNRALVPAEPGDLKERIPARILELHDSFRGCPSCGRVYWSGSHTSRMRRVVEGLLATTRPASARTTGPDEPD